MPAKLSRLFGHRRARRGEDRSYGLRLATALLDGGDPGRALVAACRLARRAAICDLAVVILGEDPQHPIGQLGGDRRTESLLAALRGRQDLADSLGGRPRFISLAEDQFQPGAPLLRRFELRWALALPFQARIGTDEPRRCVALLAGSDPGVDAHHPILRSAQLLWLLVHERLGRRASEPAGPWPDASGWEEAPAALALVTADGVVAANARAREVLAENVGRGGDGWEPWLLGAVQRLQTSGQTAEVLTASQSRGRRLSVNLGPAPDQADAPRLVAIAPASAEQVDGADHEATMRTLGHELRTPLTAMQTSLDLVLRGDAGALAGDQERFLGTARRNLERLNRLLGDLLDAKRAEAGQLAIQTETVDLGAILRDDLEMFGITCREKGIDLDTRGVPAGFRACVDTDKVQQMLHNVISNAVKYTPGGGLIRVWLQERAEAAPALGAQLARRFGLPLDAFTLVVEDSGLGMSEEFLDSLFQPFCREDRVETRRLPGAGLGLHITRGLVEAHGGEIRLSSRPGQGTTVWLVLPREPGSGRVLVAGRKLAGLRDAAVAVGVAASTVWLDVRDRLDAARPWEAEAAGSQARAFLRDLAARHPHEAAAPVLRAAGGDPCWQLAPGLWVGLALAPQRLAPAWQVATAAPESSPLLAGSRWLSLDENPAPAAPQPTGVSA